MTPFLLQHPPGLAPGFFFCGYPVKRLGNFCKSPVLRPLPIKEASGKPAKSAS